MDPRLRGRYWHSGKRQSCVILSSSSITHPSPRTYWSFRTFYLAPSLSWAPALAPIPQVRMQHADRTALPYHRRRKLAAFFADSGSGFIILLRACNPRRQAHCKQKREAMCQSSIATRASPRHSLSTRSPRLSRTADELFKSC
jgi:hypothetical protein